MYGRAFFGARYYGPRYWGNGGDVVVVVTETLSGGWARAFETETDEARKARIKAERIKLGIIEPDPPESGVQGQHPPRAPRMQPAFVPPDPGLAVDLAGLYAGAWLDQEIKRFFELQDDDDAAVLLLAIAALD